MWLVRLAIQRAVQSGYLNGWHEANHFGESGAPFRPSRDDLLLARDSATAMCQIGTDGFQTYIPAI